MYYSAAVGINILHVYNTYIIGILVDLIISYSVWILCNSIDSYTAREILHYLLLSIYVCRKHEIYFSGKVQIFKPACTVAGNVRHVIVLTSHVSIIIVKFAQS